jgi:hypothetical protein
LLPQAYDGDGQAVRRDPLASEPIFYLRSSVLGGKVVAGLQRHVTSRHLGHPAQRLTRPKR